MLFKLSAFDGAKLYVYQCMVMRNKIKAFVDTQGLTVYKFRQRTGISNKTAYDLYNTPEEYLGKEVMEKICRPFKVQPGDLLEWVDD